jgi:DNA-binding LacI/PurR family transcriptional regulator
VNPASSLSHQTGPKAKRPTILDLERYSGIKRSTISRAFCPGYSIKESTRQAVLKAAAEIGYIPNAGARLYRAQRTHRWGFLLPHLGNPDQAELTEHLDAEARRRNTFLVMGLSHFDTQLEPTLIRHWASGETDGVIVGLGSQEENRDLYAQLRRRGFPLVFLYYADPGYPVVAKDNYPTHRQAMEKLLALGHRRIGYIGYRHSSSRHVNAFQAYEDVLREHNLPLEQELLYFGSQNRAGGIDAWKYFSSQTNRPTALLAFNDILACGAWMAAQADGIKIPEDLSLVGNDDIAETAPLGVATIRYDRSAMARLVFDVLESQLQSKHPEGTRHIIPTEFIPRASIAPPRARL